MTDLLLQTAQQYQQPFYFYDARVISRQIGLLQDNFSGVDFLYSVKTNPCPSVLEYMASRQLGADAASAKEVLLSLAAGMKVEDIYYSTPGKTAQDIEQSLMHCTIIADSYSELKVIDGIARSKNITAKVGLRINPLMGMSGSQQGSSKFGVDEETLVEQKTLFDGLTNTVITGLHIHLKSQILDDATLYRYYENIFSLAQFCQAQLHFEIEFINFGSGLGIPYIPSEESALNVVKLGQNFKKLTERFAGLNARLLIETGRYVVAEAGTYVTPIVDIKSSRGVKYLLVQNGINGFLRPTIAALLKQLPVDLQHFSAEPLFTSPNAFEMHILGREGNEEQVTVAGNLCTSTDLLGEGVMLPHAQVGDFVAVSMAGSYAYTLSALLFSSHSWPLQLFLTEAGEVIECE